MDPLWKRIVGGAVGLGIMIAVVLLLRGGGVSGETVGHWQEAFVVGGALAGGLWLAKRRAK